MDNNLASLFLKIYDEGMNTAPGFLLSNARTLKHACDSIPGYKKIYKKMLKTHPEIAIKIKSTLEVLKTIDPELVNFLIS